MRYGSINNRLISDGSMRIFDMFWLMVVSCFEIGVGGVIALITANIFAAVWFRGKEITFVFALLVTSA